MEYKRLRKAIEYILGKGESLNGNFGWAAVGGQLSQTVTAQVLISLSKFSEMEKDSSRKKAILERIDNGFTYLKNTLLSDGNSLPSFAYSLVAHLDHHFRYPATHQLDTNLIIACVSRMNFFLYLQISIRCKAISNIREKVEMKKIHSNGRQRLDKVLLSGFLFFEIDFRMQIDTFRPN